MSEVAPPPSGHCANCQAKLNGPWCAQCGERVRKPGEVSLSEYLGELLEGLTNLNGRFWGSLRALLFKPGLLSADYLAGRRVRWMRPLHLFLLINLVYFFLSSWNTFTTQLHWHIGAEGFLHQSVAASLVNEEINQPPLASDEWQVVTSSFFHPDLELSTEQQAARERLSQYARLFNSRVEVYSRTLIIILIPLMTLVPLLLLALRRESPVVHLVMTTHWTSYFLLISLGSGWLINRAMVAGWMPAEDELGDVLGTLSLMVLSLVWTLPAARRVYRLGWIKAGLLALAISLWIVPALMLYRAILFFLVFWSL